ncbi:MAG: hemerythrin domain-containing protein [Methanocella sp.]
MDNRKISFSSYPLAIASSILQAGVFRPLKDRGEELEERVATPIENLMKEHGVLLRILGIYDRVTGDAESGKELNAGAIYRTAEISRDYIGKHHDACEERYIFPQFRKSHYIMDIITELHDQHVAAVKITKQILALASPDSTPDDDSNRTLKNLCKSIVSMYRPHISWEQSIVFPVFYDIVTADYIRDIRDKMEAEERKMLGETGFRGLVGRLSEIEKDVGTYDLHGYTPVIR